MARSRINVIETEDHLTGDSGSVLWSFVLGEQLEFPVVLDFLEDATLNYVFEAVVVEAANVSGQEEAPTTIEPAGVQDTLTVRLPVKRGNWDAGSAYNTEEVVLYGGIYYKLLSGTARVDPTTPDLDDLWEVTTLNKVYIQFPATLGTDYAVAPLVDAPTYGFFELRITEPNNTILVKTWKPVRGMVEFLFSPTHIVPDV